MQRKIKAQIEKAKQFAKEHPTLVACAVTGVVSWKLSHEVTLRGAIEECGTFVYVAGQEVGALEVQRDILLDFVNSKGLGDEIRQHVIGLQD